MRRGLLVALMRWALSLVVAMILAGCSSPTPAAAGDEPVPTATATTGIARIIVVDDALHPIANANVSTAGSSWLTDPEGIVIVGPLEPGVHIIAVDMTGYFSLSRAITIEAGVLSPKVEMFQISADSSTAVFYELAHWTGFLHCGVSVANLGVAACNLVYDAYNEAHFPLTQVPTFVQTELVWQSTQALSQELTIIHTGKSIYTRGDGPSPLVIQADRETLAAQLPDDLDLVTFVYPPSTTLDASFNQAFNVYTTVFYNFLPAEGWTFTTNGAPVPP